MKNFKKLMALVIAGVMVLGAMNLTALADTNNVTSDTPISVTGLEVGDQVKFIQLIKWTDSIGWEWVDGFDAAVTAAGVTVAKKDALLSEITGKLEGSTFTPGTISADNAALLAKIAAKMTSTGTNIYEDTVGEDKLADHANPDAGLYFALITPATADYVYNTIFVSSDFTSDNTTHTIGTSATLANSIAKKQLITVDKDSVANNASGGTSEENKKYDHNVGDVVDFKIETMVPAYGAGYIDPQFVIKDTLESGFAFVKADKAAATTDANDYTVTIDGVNDLAKPADYTLTIDGQVMTISLTQAGLDKVAALGVAKKITVNYHAQITSLEGLTVTEKTNDVEVKFSNKPTDKTSYSLLEDRTRNYTFEIDASLLGNEGEEYTSDEVIKIGLSANGQPLTTTKSYHSGTTWSDYSPLQGATFALFTADPDSEMATIGTSAGKAKQSTNIYKNSEYEDGCVVTSDPNGRLNIKGLDAGTYYLREIAAPSGFIRDNKTYTITITANYTEIPAGTYTNSDNILVKYGAYKVLHDYNVEVSSSAGTKTSQYNITNSGTVIKTVKSASKTNGFAGDDTTPLSNIRGTELPSTGGMGTTLFYAIGAILVLGAGVLLVSKRRMAAN